MKSMEQTEIICPVVHLNGTGGKELEEEYRKAHEALRFFREALREATFHPRDYYVLGEDAFRKAEEQRREVFAPLEAMEDWLVQIRTSLAEQMEGRR